MKTDEGLVTPDNAIDLEEAAEILRRNVDSVRRLCRAGHLAHRRDRTGRYWTSRAAIDDFFGPERLTDSQRARRALS